MPIVEYSREKNEIRVAKAKYRSWKAENKLIYNPYAINIHWYTDWVKQIRAKKSIHILKDVLDYINLVYNLIYKNKKRNTTCIQWYWCIFSLLDMRIGQAEFLFCTAGPGEDNRLESFYLWLTLFLELGHVGTIAQILTLLPFFFLFVYMY